MSSRLRHSAIWDAIDDLAARHKLTPSGLARRAGLDPTAFNKSKRLGKDGRERWPSMESIAKVLDATGSDLSAFLGGEADQRKGAPPSGAFPPQPSTIPLLGLARAGTGGFFDDGGFPVGQGWDEVDFPAPARTSHSVYALEVQGDSMLPLYRDGDVLIVEANAETRKGDRVVVKTHDGEVMAKVLVRRTSRQIELMSINPAHENLTFDLSAVEWIARIIWASQ
ncbi:LexA family transcriptional regulator [Martelella radicis]|uniref:Phage repressor protein C with HTH and peptisase S24 domain n=1 Tax=Martelella radicis TaxID=1397476 RepID=A0A7W6KKZ1_9HYPH|nr:helix-turn-helix transcriptional regulator [Martelella radicis]MBB4123166.1 phage repressor protein C with HTH and peptisase S24 domain [Martelella radicis]